MKSRIIYVNYETTILEIHPLALPYAQAWLNLKRHWTPQQLSLADLNNIQEFTIICAVKLRKKYLAFSDFEAVRILRQNQTKTWALRVFEDIDDDSIKQIAASFLTQVKIYNLDRYLGLASLQSSVTSHMDGKTCRDYFGHSLFKLRPSAPLLGLSPKELRTQHKRLAGGRK